MTPKTTGLSEFGPGGLSVQMQIGDSFNKNKMKKKIVRRFDASPYLNTLVVLVLAFAIQASTITIS
jgi:hypothetical protein